MSVPNDVTWTGMHFVGPQEPDTVCKCIRVLQGTVDVLRLLSMGVCVTVDVCVSYC